MPKRTELRPDPAAEAVTDARAWEVLAYRVLIAALDALRDLPEDAIEELLDALAGAPEDGDDG